jgi:hypothetical protein
MFLWHCIHTQVTLQLSKQTRFVALHVQRARVMQPQQRQTVTT